MNYKGEYHARLPSLIFFYSKVVRIQTHTQKKLIHNLQDEVRADRQPLEVLTVKICSSDHVSTAECTTGLLCEGLSHQNSQQEPFYMQILSIHNLVKVMCRLFHHR